MPTVSAFARLLSPFVLSSRVEAPKGGSKGGSVQENSNNTQETTYDVDDEIRLPQVSCDTQDPSTGYHATLDGTPEGDGSLSSPWDLNTALRHPNVVEPGDTIWVHEGVYKGSWVAKLDGVEGAPITIAAWPGDRVTLDNVGGDVPVLQIFHEWAVFRGLELTDSQPDRSISRSTGIWAGGDHISLQNLIVHDVGSGISGGQLTDDVQAGNFIELHGCLFYNNGWRGTDRGHGYHIYITNRDSKMVLEENLIFSAYGTGIHVYSESDRNYVRNFDFVGNVWFLNGAPGHKLVDGFLAGHNGSLPVKDILLKENYGWATLGGRDVRMGWGAGGNRGATLVDNYFVGQTIFQRTWSDVTMNGNTIIGNFQSNDSGILQEDYPDNSYQSERPVKNHIVVRPNRYQPGRAHVIVYNWENFDSVEVDLSKIMSPGDSFVLRNSQDYFGEVTQSGIYEGGLVNLPMHDLLEVLPVGETQAFAETTGRDFKVFVLEAQTCKK